MVGRVKHEPDALSVVFEREGEVMERAHARDGRQAVLRAASIIIGQGELRAGDKLFVLAVDDGTDDDVLGEDRG